MPGCRSLLAAAVVLLPAAFVQALHAQEPTSAASSTQTPKAREIRLIGFAAAIFDQDHFNHTYVAGHGSLRTAANCTM